MKIQTQFYPKGLKIRHNPKDRETPMHICRGRRTIDKCESLPRAQWQVAQLLTEGV